ncbi:SpoIID/LytB domain-containing protein [uncultured Tyzzerella sp.]|uniref:SpoIID/LytB domain-containing protein n=1 Tax=uncultured Tyzzerella sp. TaxID=2321398 RepID=UPI002943D489|nr:SpoIID/LytB domain-containing protein [uncultured Tyzzerella sp.]
MGFFSKNYENSYIYKDNDYYVMIGNFNNSTDANNTMISKNINGEVVHIDNSIGIYDNNHLLAVYKNSITIKSNDYISLLNKKYRNLINIICKNNSLSVINTLDIEEYLYGVVPSEMPSSWHKEALKAQAVTARNYAYANLGTHKKDGYDVCDTVHCQVYNGVNNEKQSTTDAINETKGVFAYYNNELINAVYSSSSGGYTDDAENVWNNSVPYLKAVKDEYEEGAKQWTRTFTFDELSSMASIGTVNEIILENSSVTGRVNKLTLIGTNGEKVLEKEEVRTFFSKHIGGSLDSKNFKMLKANNYISANSKQDNIEKDNTIYAISSKGSSAINRDVFVIDKNTTSSEIDNMYVINKNQNISNLLPKNKDDYNTNSNINYVSKLTRKDSNSVTFVGKGWGHGVGMSQYGANSLAKKGYKYDEILKYYYTGIEVK